MVSRSSPAAPKHLTPGGPAKARARKDAYGDRNPELRFDVPKERTPTTPLAGKGLSFEITVRDLG